MELPSLKKLKPVHTNMDAFLTEIIASDTKNYIDEIFKKESLKLVKEWKKMKG